MPCVMSAGNGGGRLGSASASSIGGCTGSYRRLSNVLGDNEERGDTY